MTIARETRTRWGAAAAALLLSASALDLVWRMDAATAWRVFLANLLFWSGLGTGAAALVALFDMTGAQWPGPIRAIAERIARVCALSYPLYLLLPAGMSSLFGRGAGVWQVAIRDCASLAAYHAIFLLFSRRRRSWAAAAVLLGFVTVMSVVSIDTVMRFEPDWTSTLFPAYFAATAMYSALAAVAMAAAITGRAADLLAPARARDLAKLLFGFSLLWAYLLWSQYLVIWYGNLPDEFAFLTERVRGGWRYVATAVVVCGFAAPAGLLLLRRTGSTVAIAGPISAIGIWLERLLLVAPPHPWRVRDFGLEMVLTMTLVACLAWSVACTDYPDVRGHGDHVDPRGRGSAAQFPSAEDRRDGHGDQPHGQPRVQIRS
jgi:hypothetical protein